MCAPAGAALGGGAQNFLRLGGSQPTPKPLAGGKDSSAKSRHMISPAPAAGRDIGPGGAPVARLWAPNVRYPSVGRMYTAGPGPS